MFVKSTLKILVRKNSIFMICCALLTTIGLFLLMLIHYKDETETPTHRKYIKKKSHALCVIVPFKDRFEELLEFTPYMIEFLSKQKIRHHIFVINQIDSLRFNRGSLINVGFKYSTNLTNCDYIVMHDVDLLPINDNISYAYPDNHAFHVASPNLHPKYHYETFIGGILIMNKKIFKLVNGLSNRYWGWGMEDDELYLRLKNRRIDILRPGGLTTGSSNSFRHIHGPERRRDQMRCFNQAQVNFQRDRLTGLNNVNYEIVSDYKLQINSYPVTLVNVKLSCNKILTPWCSCN